LSARRHLEAFPETKGDPRDEPQASHLRKRGGRSRAALEVIRAFKIRCYPTAGQRRQFARAGDAGRYVHNRVLKEMG
jgi:hypothetical protein